MRYLLIIHIPWTGEGAPEPALIAEIMATHERVEGELRASGEFVETGELARNDARWVRTTTGTPIVTDGPFTEGKEVIGGYYLVDCDTFDRATDIAGQFAEARFGAVEVRRIGSDDD